MKNRFDLDQQITKMVFFSDNLRDLSQNIIENELSKNQISDALNGLAVLIDSYNYVTMDIMKQVFKLDEYKNYQEMMQK